MTTLVRVPRIFFDDHRSRDLPTPKVHRTTKTHYFIDPADPAVPELLDDAEFYASEYRYMDRVFFGLGRSAAATAKALREADGNA